MTAKTKAGSVRLTGFCRDAGLIEAGVIGSESGPEAHHALCTGSIRLPKGTVWRCECPCHEGQPEIISHMSEPCVKCGAVTTPHDCDEVVGAREDNPVWRRLQENRREVEARKAEIAREEALDREKNPPPPRRQAGRCEHCGEPTKGGKFVPGHDAKLKGGLFTDAREGDVDATAELLVRGWWCKGIAQVVEFAAKDLATEEWLVGRVARRIGEVS